MNVWQLGINLKISINELTRSTGCSCYGNCRCVISSWQPLKLSMEVKVWIAWATQHTKAQARGVEENTSEDLKWGYTDGVRARDKIWGLKGILQGLGCDRNRWSGIGESLEGEWWGRSWNRPFLSWRHPEVIRIE